VEDTFFFETHLYRSGASDVHIVSHMCRRSTFSDAQDDAKEKKDNDFVTKNNPAVSPAQLTTSQKYSKLKIYSASSMLTSRTAVRNKSCF
jgi:hypothetical protein